MPRTPRQRRVRIIKFFLAIIGILTMIVFTVLPFFTGGGVSAPN